MDKTLAVEPALVLNDKLIIRTGIHNGIDYSEEEIKNLFLKYKAIEAKHPSQRTIQEKHALSLFKGADEDHRDSSETWIGDVEGIYWDEKNKAIGAKKWNIIDEGFAKKIQYQKSKGNECFGASPRLNVLRQGTKATDIIPRNISIVLEPAGGEQLLLSRQPSSEGEREDIDNIVEELTLSDQTVLQGKEQSMSGLTKEEFLQAMKELKADETSNQDSALKKEVEELKEQLGNVNAELQKKKEEEEKMKKEAEALAKKEEEERLQAEKDAEKKKKEEEEMAKKKEEEAKMQAGKDKTKYKYYGKEMAKNKLKQALSVKPNLALLDKTSIDRVVEDITNASKLLDIEKGYTLEQAQKAVEDMHTIMMNLPIDENEEEKVLERVTEVLSATVSQSSSSSTETKSDPSKPKPRKGLIVSNTEREEAALSKSEGGNEDVPKSISDMNKGELENALGDILGGALGVK